tara:strand:+ start:5835 stop:5957 length:123 start_codon:yes stop_codon:yes gene_type:complete
MSTIIISYFVYHIGKEVGRKKRTKEILENINKLNKNKDNE